MARKIVLAFIALALAIVFVAYKRSKEFQQNGPFSVESVSPVPMLSPDAPGAATPATGAITASPQPQAVESEWSAFVQKFGPDLEPTYSRGILTSVRKTGRSATVGKFYPTQAQHVIARAREIVDALARELRLPSDRPLGDPLFQGNQLSAQVHFRQLVDGVPLAPYGGVTVWMGSAGELERLDSNAIPGGPGTSGIEVTNRPVLSVNDARGRAVQAFFSRQSDWSAGPPVEGGTHVVWMSRPLSERGPAEGRHAYDFNVGGDQIVIDAQTGEVLHRRSARRH